MDNSTITFDLYNLAAFNYDSVRIPEEDAEDYILDLATTHTQEIMKKLLDCPIKPTEYGPAAELPAETSRLPREKRIPEPKAETRWEKFAKEKGIKNKKRDRMVYDENTDDFRPRFGYKRANTGIDEIPIVEVKTGSNPFADPWAASKKAKGEKVAKNLHNQMNNKLKAAGKPIKRTGGAGFDPSKIPGIPVDIGSKPGKRGRDGVQRALQLAQHATASLGRFDETRPGEPEKKIRGKKRSFRDNLENHDADKAAMKAQIRFVADKADKKSRGVTNSLAAYEGILPDAPSDQFKSKKGKGKISMKSTGKSPSKSGPPGKKRKM